MPKILTNRQAHPAVLENPKRVGEFIQEGFGGQVDFYNMYSDSSILIGEPMVVYDRLAISKFLMLPNSLGQIHFGAWVNFLLDPAMAADILMGDPVYFNLGLADSDVPGYATGVQPANGYFLGHATLVHEQSSMQLDDDTGKPIAATTNDLRVGVLMHQEKMVWGTNFWGTVPDFVNGDSVLSS